MPMLQLSLGSVLEEQGDQGMRPFEAVTIIKKQHTTGTLAGTAGMNKYPQHVSHEYSCFVDQLMVVAGACLTWLVKYSDLTN